MDQKFVVSDICDTLFYSNTTFDFIKYCLNKDAFTQKKYRYNLFLKRNSPLFWLLAIAGKVTGADLHKQFAVSLFKGLTENELNIFAEGFYNEYLVPRKIKPTFQKISQFQGKELVLASASIAPVVKAIAQALGAKYYVATEVEFKNGICTGKMLEELSGKKAAHLHQKLNIKSENIFAVLSDNFTDKGLLRIAREKYAICYNETQVEYWQDVPEINLINLF